MTRSTLLATAAMLTLVAPLAAQDVPEAGLDALREAASARWSALGFQTQVVDAGGRDLFVATAGAGRPLLLLHGYPQSGEIWRDVATELATTHRVIVPDLPGMGLSDLGGDRTLGAVSDTIAALLEALGAEDVAIVAHDWGAAVGAVHALENPGAVDRLAFIESAVAGAGFEEVWTFAAPNEAMTFIPVLLSEGLTEALVEGREAAFLEHLWSTFTADTGALPWSEWAPYVAAMERGGQPHAAAAYYRAVYEQIDDTRALLAGGRLSIPVLSISGSASFGDAQRGFVDAFAADVAHVTIEGAGHFVAEERPAALMDALSPFLAD